MCLLTTCIVGARCGSKMYRTRCGAGAISVVEWATVSEGQTATLTHHQTGAVTHYNWYIAVEGIKVTLYYWAGHSMQYC